MNIDQLEDIYGHVGKMIINTIEGIVKCEPMRDTGNNAIAVYEDPAPVLPHTMSLLSNRELCKLLTQQRARLLTTMTPAD